MLIAAWEFDSASVLKARECRLEFTALLRQYGGPGSDFDGAELIFGELIGNVVRHAPGAVSIRLEWGGVFPTLAVHDEEDAFTANFNLPDDPLRENGRGMFIIKQLAISIDVQNVPNDGTRVVVKLPVYNQFPVATADMSE